MSTRERIELELEQVVAAQRAVLRSLDGALLSDTEARGILKQLADLSRLVEVATVRATAMVEPLEGRTAKTQLAHEMRVSRKYLHDSLKVAAETTPTAPGLECPEGRPPRMSQVAAAMEEGHCGIDAAVVISRILEQIPMDAPKEARDYAERTLAELSQVLGPDDLKLAGRKILQGLNAESAPTDADRQRRRGIRLSNQGEDLMATLTGSVTPELHALLSRLFADYAGPGDLLPEEEKAGDRRGAAQRRHDALVAALKTAMGEGGGMQPTRGCATVVATMPLEQLQQAAGAVTTDVGTLLPIRDLLRLGATRNAFLAILDKDTGNLIELGKTKRCGDLFAYLGAVAAQGGDMTPGSDIPAAWCELHHVLPWKYGGRTTGFNLALVSPKNHGLFDDDHEDPDKYWTYCTRTGHMLWKPPKQMDPERRPRANFNPALWFTPGQMLKFGMYRETKTPPFQYGT
ncbi:HNH endonuclease signature motif containing protein [Corynebacterium sp. H130]|uniref:HNH endonuclease signature motif containing protein n=1 Tax=Corynebacterium sp. H130 TaxID=3133444 RepID=UPI0030A442D1